MRMDKLTSKFQEALADAQSLALGRDQQYIDPLHVMLALLDQESGSIKPLLIQTAVNVSAMRAEISQEIEKLPTVSGAEGDVQLSNELSRMLNLTDKFAQQRKDNFISSELFLLAACETKGTVQALLKRFGVNKAAIEKAIDNMRGGQTVDDASAEDQRQALKKYTINLTERAEQSKLDPVIGRDDEIRRTTSLAAQNKKQPGIDR